jgi:hypothetical protein
VASSPAAFRRPADRFDGLGGDATYIALPEKK